MCKHVIDTFVSYHHFFNGPASTQLFWCLCIHDLSHSKYAPVHTRLFTILCMYVHTNISTCIFMTNIKLGAVKLSAQRGDNDRKIGVLWSASISEMTFWPILQYKQLFANATKNWLSPFPDFPGALNSTAPSFIHTHLYRYNIDLYSYIYIYIYIYIYAHTYVYLLAHHDLSHYTTTHV
jgi:hypothetical protein